jgi:UDPglucose 6-dehydrogenase
MGTKNKFRRLYKKAVMKKQNYKIGIVGRGFVGSAVQFGFSPNVGCDAEIRVYDKDITKSTHTLEETMNESDFIFLSVPTPSNSDGSMNIDILENVLFDIQAVNKRSGNIILIRSTVTPGTTTKLARKFTKLNIVFNPEFLTERSAKFDFINQCRFIIGGRKRNTAKVAKLFKWRFGDSIPVIETNFNTAEMIKYMNNCFFATKVSFMNEMKLIADASNVDWDMAVEGFVRDGRIGHTHLNVPGPDGRMGFGGSCFPKDIQAMIAYSIGLGIDTHTLKGAWSTNLAVRPERDWENLKGRAVVENGIVDEVG